MQRDSGRVSRPLFAFGAVTAGVIVALVLRAVVAQVYLVPSGSMAPTLRIGDRVLVEKVSRWVRPVQVGDVIVFDATDVWTAATNHLLVTKRVVGVAGDRVVCCDDRGRIVRNGRPMHEPYLLGPAATAPLDVVVPEGRLWVLGDDRAHSRDSAWYQGTSGGGSVPVNHVIGRIVAVVWPPGRAGILGTPQPKDANDPA